MKVLTTQIRTRSSSTWLGPSSLIIALLALGDMGCRSEGLAAPETLAAVDAQEASAFADKLIDAALSCQPAKMAEVVDVDAVQRRALRASTLNARLQKTYYAEFRPHAASLLSGLFQCDERSGEADISLAGYRQVHGHTSILLGFSGEGISYWEFVIGKTSRGIVIADDVVNFADGLLFSERLTDYVNAVAADSPNTVKTVDAISLLGSSPAEGLAGVESLPSHARKTKHMRLTMLSALASVDLDGYQEAEKSFRADFPKHPPMHLLDFESMMTGGKGEGALAAIDALDEELGNPPFIDLLRLRVAFEFESHYALGLAMSQEMVRKAPDDFQAHEYLLTAQVLLQHNDAALATMFDIGQRFDLIWGPESAQDPFWQDFARTPQWTSYQEWLLENEAQVEDPSAEESSDDEHAPRTDPAHDD